jgi:mannose-6-phosphate isomerase-like protein (cupin superfamily)
MKGFHDNIEKLTKENENFRQVLYTGEHSQLVLMTLKPGENIGMETHPDIDQFFRIEDGEGKAVIDGNEYQLSDDDAVIVPAGAEHDLMNTSETESLKLYTIYSPPEHPDGTVHKTREEAMEYEKEHHHHG